MPGGTPSWPRPTVDAMSEIRTYHPRRGRVTPTQAEALRTLLPRYAVPEGRIDTATLFGGRPVVVEIGFGLGHATVEMAQADPGTGIVAADVHTPGVGRLLNEIEQHGLDNVRVLHGDAVELLRERVDEGALAGVRAFFPDPWPKARHHRRRFVTPDYLLPLARIAAPGAEFRVATDIPDYVRQTLEEVPPAGFELVAQAGQGEAWDDWLSTRYEQKALREGRQPHYLTFRRA